MPDFPSKHIGLMLDYDGTLTPIVENPEDARISSDKLNTLKRWIESPHASLAIVSGRSVQQLEGFLSELTSLPIVFCGLHGGEVMQYPERHKLKEPSRQLKSKVS